MAGKSVPFLGATLPMILKEKEEIHMSGVVSMNTPNKTVKTPRRSFLFFKRAMDILFAAVLAVALLPLELVLAVVSALDTKASPLFLQTRVGKNGKMFRCLKFRTMNKNAPANVATCDLESCRYISSVGRFIRRTSLDELPQFWNILKGDMSFVGPRPVIPQEKELIRLRRLHHAETVRPGLTGWSQVNGRDNLRVTKKAFMDGYYARHATLLFDLKILTQTVSRVLRSDDVVDGRVERPAETPVPQLSRTAS